MASFLRPFKIYQIWDFLMKIWQPCPKTVPATFSKIVSEEDGKEKRLMKSRKKL
jgi:hypothetical protein